MTLAPRASAGVKDELQIAVSIHPQKAFGLLDHQS